MILRATISVDAVLYDVQITDADVCIRNLASERTVYERKLHDHDWADSVNLPLMVDFANLVRSIVNAVRRG